MHSPHSTIAQTHEFIQKRATEGRSALAEGIRRLLIQTSSDDAAVFESWPLATLLEPSLFAQFSCSSVPDSALLPLLAGLLDADARPSLFEVEVPNDGGVYIPGQGVFEHPPGVATLELQGARYLTTSPRRLGRPLRVPGTTATLRGDFGIHMRAIVDANYPYSNRVNSVGDPSEYIAPLEEALSAIAAVDPAYHALLNGHVRECLLMRHPDANSFAAVGAHGAVFFNVHRPARAAYFVEELVHQGGHVIFTAATVRRSEFIAIDADTPLEELLGVEEHRSIYDAFHGLYTEMMMCEVMRAVDEAGLLPGPQAFELWGRLAYISAKFAIDAANIALRLRHVFTPIGVQLCRTACESQRRIATERPDLARACLDDQPYEFDLETFVRMNPSLDRSRRPDPAQVHPRAG